MNHPNTTANNFELEVQNLEAFMPIGKMRDMTQATLLAAGRIDESGIAQPIEVKRNLHGDKWAMGPETDSVWRSDIFIPTQEDLQRQIVTDDYGLTTKNRVVNPRIEDALYNYLTGKEKVSLSEEQARGVDLDQQALEETISVNRAYDLTPSTEQLEDAYHIVAIDKPEPEFAKTRIYVPAGINAVALANAVFEAGVNVNSAKVWTPRVTTEEQYIRHDTPIFEVTTFAQLESILSVLRQLAQKGKLPVGETPVAGYAVEDLPGVYVGQTQDKGSFNGRMKKLFGKSIREACEPLKLQAGDIVDASVLNTIASDARRLAQGSAADTATDPYNHAFHEGQPIQRILDTINQSK